MARLPRYFAPDQPQHIIQRGVNRSATFVEASDYLCYLEALHKAATQYGCKIHAYVLMTNHVHLLLTPSLEKSIPLTLQSIGRKYVQYFNYCYQRTGTLWEGRYRATVIDTEAYLLTCYRYIELNPVRAQMVEHPRDYPWSSYRYHAYGKQSQLGAVIIADHDLFLKLGHNEVERQTTYRELINRHLDHDTLDAIREATNKGWALGNDRFRDEIELLCERRATPQPKGRPCKKT